LQDLNIEQSLMWRSKPSQLRTWSQRWKRDSWFRHLSGRILKPCQHTAFETELMSSLAVIPASHSQQQDFAKAQKTLDTYGHTSTTTYEQLDLFAASSRTSKDTSALDSEKSLQTWKALVTRLRGEYLARLKSARLTSVRGSTSWPTPQARDHRHGSTPTSTRMQRKAQQGFSPNLNDSVLMWPTPRTTDTHQGRGVVEINGKLYRPSKALSEGKLIGGANLADSVKMFPTPTVQDLNKATKKMREDHQNNLTAVVFDQASFPTPTARDYKGGYKEKALTRKDGKSRRFDALPNAAINGQGTDVVPGHLSADWVEGLMGLPLGWTDLGKWGSSE